MVVPTPLACGPSSSDLASSTHPRASHRAELPEQTAGQTLCLPTRNSTKFYLISTKPVSKVMQGESIMQKLLTLGGCLSPLRLL